MAKELRVIKWDDRSVRVGRFVPGSAAEPVAGPITGENAEKADKNT